ncbi:GNAT family N-acetyltransferase [Homoserinibacter sp. YIM 151385]|uniref:GNAT family N-acetyltransferase n=1 Tax=Homoserinibacter sp. YIM 151385 TaxID=2985506 RepID=UPI0022F07608|nr:GNAT family N-acetyltransferase [Homoserinibacter sp. YIM 151385]WBU37703.1 GNAT family N-acetyltransferase [Homoserinibacter sp. YIM 151385]
MTLPPLSDRVPALGVPGIPAGPDGVHWRPAALDDVDALHDAIADVGRAEHPHFTIPREEVEEDLRADFADLDRDSLVAHDGTGRVLGYGLALRYPGQETIQKSILLGGVRPDDRGRGIGRRILDWQLARGAEQLRALDDRVPGWFQTWAYDVEGPQVRLLEHGGFRIARWFQDLHRDLAEPIAARELAGYQIVPLSSELHEATRLARNDAFRDHWSSQPSAPEVWASAMRREVQRPDLSRVALAPDGSVAGFVLVEHNPEDTPAQGFSGAYIGLVGTVREHRRRGVAPALLAEVLRASRDAGLERAVLDVDSESPTGATGLYAALGFTEAQRSASLTIEF